MADMIIKQGFLLILLVAGFVGESPVFGQERSGSVSAMDEVREWTVALDGRSDFTSIQEAIDQASSGDTIWIAAGTYAEDVTVHSKDGLTIIGESMDKVVLTGKQRVGTLHIGKWPYGATNVTIRGLTVLQHGGLGVGIFNGSGVLLQQIRVRGMVFSQQVQNVTLEQCVVGESETTGIAMSDSTGALIENVIHDNDHGVALGGRSNVRLEKNIVTKSLFEGVQMTDQAEAEILQNTFVNNGGGVAFHDEAKADVQGNILVNHQTAFLFSPSSRTNLAFNALYGNKEDYLLEGTPPLPVPARAGRSDVSLPPGFVRPDAGDFRLRADTPLVGIGEFPFLGALPPIPSIQ